MLESPRRDECARKVEALYPDNALAVARPIDLTKMALGKVVDAVGASSSDAVRLVRRRKTPWPKTTKPAEAGFSKVTVSHALMTLPLVSRSDLRCETSHWRTRQKEWTICQEVALNWGVNAKHPSELKDPSHLSALVPRYPVAPVQRPHRRG